MFVFLIEIVLNQGICAISFRKPHVKTRNCADWNRVIQGRPCSSITKVDFSYHIQNLNWWKPFFCQFLNLEIMYL